MKDPMQMSRAELAVACEAEAKRARLTAGHVLSQVQIRAIEGSGLAIVPDWMVRVLLKTLAPAGDGS